MAVTLDHAADTTGVVRDESALGVFLDATRREQQAARDKLAALADWIAAHTDARLVGPADGWHERELPVGGEGAATVPEFALVELAATAGLTLEAARTLVSDVAELRYRLPRTWARVLDGDLPGWRARRVAQATYALPPAAAGFVDRHLAPFAHQTGPAQLQRLVDTALAMHDPDTLEAARLAAETRHVTLGDPAANGTIELTAILDLADGLDLDTALSQGAARLAALGSPETLQVRRSQALGELARRQLALDLTTHPEPEAGGPVKPRQVVLYAHLAADAITGTGLANPSSHARLAELENTKTIVTTEQIADWCRQPGTHVTIRPVIDLNTDHSTRGYHPTEHLQENVILRDRTCRFPHCTRPARHTDLDHTQPWEHDGTTSSTNLAALCRTHHRAKTTGGWTYTHLQTGHYLWTSPTGRRWLVDPTGTTPLAHPADSTDP